MTSTQPVRLLGLSWAVLPHQQGHCYLLRERARRAWTPSKYVEGVLT